MLFRSSTLEGFLRGIAVIDDRIFVGLTARREAGPEHQVARIVCLDRKTLETISQRELPTAIGRAVYSVHDATAQYATFTARRPVERERAL